MTEQSTTTTETVTVWEYEYKGSQGTYWLPEDTEEQAVEHAKYITSTGRVRSQEKTITIVSSPWKEFTVSQQM